MPDTNMLTEEQKIDIISYLNNDAVRDELSNYVWNRGLKIEDLKKSPDFDINLLEKLINSLWDFAQKENTPEAYKKYKSICDGHTQKYFDMVNSMISSAEEEACWNACETLSDCQSYIAKYPNGKHLAEAENKITNLQQKKEKEIYNECRDKADEYEEKESYLDAIAELQKYLEQYPNGSYADRVNKRITDLNNKSGHAQIIENLRNNHNAYAVPYLKSMGITPDDLKGVIDQKILDAWDKSGINLQMGQQEDSIPGNYTEVYFWGTTGSGKTCALASILSYGNSDGIMNGTGDGGVQYYDQLSGMFTSDAVSVLPSGTPLQNQYLPFDLNDDNGKKHRIALIEIAGGIFQCFQNDVYKQAIPDTHQATYDNLLNLLKDSKNPKIHFFVIDADNNSMDPDTGQTQKNYLKNAAIYMEKHKLFSKNNTCGLHIIVTKSDLCEDVEGYLNENYKNFINRLNDIAIECKLIGKGEGIDIIPFSIGKVYLKDRAIFKETKAKKIVKKLQKETGIVRKSWISGISNIFNG